MVRILESYQRSEKKSEAEDLRAWSVSAARPFKKKKGFDDPKHDMVFIESDTYSGFKSFYRNRVGVDKVVKSLGDLPSSDPKKHDDIMHHRNLYWDRQIEAYTVSIEEIKEDIKKAKEMHKLNPKAASDGTDLFHGTGNGRLYEYWEWENWFKDELVKHKKQLKRYESLKELDSKVESMQYIGKRKSKWDSKVMDEAFYVCFIDEKSGKFVRQEISLEDVKEMFSQKYIFMLMHRYYTSEYHQMLHVGDYVTWENVKRERLDKVIPQKALEYQSVGYDPKMKNIFFIIRRKRLFKKLRLNADRFVRLSS